jgi:midasin
MVRIHLDDQMDSKSLVGAYVCTQRPGEFAWQPGPLTQAVAQGRWLLVEDVNLAPAEVLAALVPLLERRTLTVAARGDSVAAAPGFQLIATVTSAPGGTAAGAYGSSQAVKDLLGGLFHYVAGGRRLAAALLAATGGRRATKVTRAGRVGGWHLATAEPARRLL